MKGIIMYKFRAIWWKYATEAEQVTQQLQLITLRGGEETENWEARECEDVRILPQDDG